MQLSLLRQTAMSVHSKNLTFQRLSLSPLPGADMMICMNTCKSSKVQSSLSRNWPPVEQWAEWVRLLAMDHTLWNGYILLEHVSN